MLSIFNTVFHYSFDSQKLRLHGDWECGLCQIIYLHNWETLRSKETEIVINDKLDEHTFTVKIPGMVL